MEQIDLWALEAQCRREGALLVCGADEAGAGPLAGDVYAAAVILPWGWVPEGLNDSKQVTPKRRDRLFDEIREKAVAWAGISCPHRTVVKGDSLSANIAAASILAKVSRDRYMEEMAKVYPEYEFDRHKGYPTKRHYELLRQYGPCPIHRKSFLKKFYAGGETP